MKITRLKKGYAIRLNDGEFAALDHLVARGMADFEGESPDEWSHLGAARRHIFQGRFASITAMAVDDDRRRADRR